MQMAAGKFKAKCLKLMDQVQKNHEEIVITKHGKPIAKLVSIQDTTKPSSLLGCLKGSVHSYKKPLEPVGQEDWELK